MKISTLSFRVLWVLFLGGLMCVPDFLHAQTKSKMPPGWGVFLAKGTGRTTGHIADFIVTNKADFPVVILPQSFYIPPKDAYQRYVGRTPGPLTVHPGETITLPVEGYCADISKPPVPAGEDMPPVSEWRAVGEPEGVVITDLGLRHDEEHLPGVSVHPGTVILDVLPPLDERDIPSISATLEKKTPKDQVENNIILTWPGTDIPVNGKLRPDRNPNITARIYVTAWEQIERAADDLLEKGIIQTPFSNNPPRERESVIQQTLWWYTAKITGEDYEIEDFAGKVYEQFEENNGMAVDELGEEQRDRIDQGVEDFWSSFMATGVEAKIISRDSPGVADLPVYFQSAESILPSCDCDTVTVIVKKIELGLTTVAATSTLTRFGPGSHAMEVEIDEEKFEKGQSFTFEFKIKCKPCEEVPCHPYKSEKAGEKKETTMSEARKNKVRIREVKSSTSAQVSKKTDTDTGVEVEVEPNKGSAGYYLTVNWIAHCMADECRDKNCYKNINLKVTPLTQAEKEKREAAEEARKAREQRERDRQDRRDQRRNQNE